jgi:hypothetical protein
MAGLDEPQTLDEVGLEGILTAPTLGAASSGDAPEAPRPAGRRRGTGDRATSYRMAMKVAAFVMVLAVVGTATFLFLGWNPSAEASVARAMSSTLNDRTADLTVTGSVGVGTAKVAVIGSGSVDFTQNAAQLQLGTSIRGQAVSVSEVTVGDTIFLNPGPLVGLIEPGKSWVSMDLSQLNQGGGVLPFGIEGGLSTNNPSVLINDLGQRGNTVTALGPSTINGTAVQGYAVQVNQAAIGAALANAHLPSWLQQGVAVSSNANISYDVFVDGTGLLYRMTVDANVPVAGRDLNAIVSMDFSNYGAATSTIAAPPAGQVATYQDIRQRVEALAPGAHP